jgi:iron complex transport system substrate-binding protein
MAKWFHPELFGDLDPKAIHQQYLTDFMGIDYDLNEHGVFAYPEP